MSTKCIKIAATLVLIIFTSSYATIINLDKYTLNVTPLEMKGELTDVYYQSSFGEACLYSFSVVAAVGLYLLIWWLASEEEEGEDEDYNSNYTPNLEFSFTF